MATKEDIYDTQIHPLMQQIIEICMQHRIAMVNCFELPTETDHDLNCCSFLVNAEFEPTPRLLKMAAYMVATMRLVPLKVELQDRELDGASQKVVSSYRPDGKPVNKAH